MLAARRRTAVSAVDQVNVSAVGGDQQRRQFLAPTHQVLPDPGNGACGAFQ